MPTLKQVFKNSSKLASTSSDNGANSISTDHYQWQTQVDLFIQKRSNYYKIKCEGKKKSINTDMSGYTGEKNRAVTSDSSALGWVARNPKTYLIKAINCGQ